MRVDDTAAGELRRLIALVDDRGLAETRPDVQALLDASRRALPPARPAPGVLGAKLAGLARGMLHLALPVALLWIGWARHADVPERPGLLALAGIAPALLALHRHALAAIAYEAQFRLRYHAAMARDWIAEAFSVAAEHRLAAAAAALEVMAAWRRWRAWLPRRPAFEDVEAFLADAYGEPAAAGWRDAVAAAHAGPPGFARRLDALRWSALIPLFQGLAAAGRFRPAPPPPPPRASPAAATPTHPGDIPDTIRRVEDPITLERRRELIELIKRKRLEITRAYNWPMRKPEEIRHRDSYIAAMRADVAVYEDELRTLPAGPA